MTAPQATPAMAAPELLRRISPDCVAAYMAARWWRFYGESDGQMVYGLADGSAADRRVRIPASPASADYHLRVAELVGEVSALVGRPAQEVLDAMFAMATSPGQPWMDAVATLAGRFTVAADRIEALPPEARFGDKAVVGLAMRARAIPGYDRPHDALGHAFAKRLGFRVVGGNGLPEARIHYVAVTAQGLRAAAKTVANMRPRGAAWRAIDEVRDVIAAGRFRRRPTDSSEDGASTMGYEIQFWDVAAQTSTRPGIPGWEGAMESVRAWVERLGGVAHLPRTMFAGGHMHATISAENAPRIAEHVLVRDVSVAARIELR